jgi:iron complex outermembrane receptor protein
MRKFTLSVLCVLMTTLAFAQQKGKASITILNEQKLPAENVTVELLRSKDSVLVKTSITDKAGIAEFENIGFNSYIIRASAVGMNNGYTNSFSVTESQTSIELPSISLTPKPASQLQNVTVSAKKPFIQKLSDRIVVNVESSPINAGSSAIEILERSPGVTIDQNDNISLRGKSGVIIMIDGKRTPMSGQDLANYLRGLPTNAIDRIDIITNPSAKYEAAGSSGIIDIRMKKDQRLGVNGTLTAGYGQGVYPKKNAGTTFNYRDRKVNVFGNYNFSSRTGLNHLILDRNFYTNGVFDGEDKKDNYTTFPSNSHVARLGMDFFPSKKTIVGFVVNSNFIDFSSDNHNNSTVIDKNYQPAYTFQTRSTGDNHLNNSFGNINLKHTFDSLGRELTVDVDYGVFQNKSASTNNTAYYKLSGGSYKPTYVLNGNQHGTLKLQSNKVDYVYPFSKNSKLESGVKTSYVSSDNDQQFFDASSGTPVNDETKTNQFIYNEYNYAGYLNYSKEWKKWNAQIGLRGEQTKIKTHQIKGNQKFDTSYFQLFPSAFVNYKLKENQTLGLSVSRRIDRPNYSNLNPFLFLIDVSTYGSGNTALKPQFTWSYELNYTLKELNFTLGYSHTKDVENVVIARFKDVFPNIQLADSNVTVEIPVNLNTSDYFGLTVSAPVHVTRWWNMINNINVYYNHFNGNLGGSQLNNGSPAADARVNNNFTFKKGWSAELNASLNTGGRYGYMVARPQWGLSTGAQKLVLKNKGTIRFNITDIFWTNLPKATITYPGTYVEKWHAFRESRIANLSFTFRFGNNKVQAARRRTTASEDERRRAGGN